MPITPYQFGLSSFGIPLVGNGNVSIPNQQGKVYFVDSNTGSDGDTGLSPAAALASIQEAIDKCVSDQGDTIFVFAGSYDENLVIENKNYISIIGATLPGYAKPDIVATSGVALYVKASQGVVLRHLRLSSGDADVVQNEGNGFLFQDCVFDGDGQAATECLVRLRGNADDDSYTASEGRIIDCLFRGCPGIGLIFDTGSAPSNGVGCTDVEVIGCRFYSNTGADIATKDSGGGVYSIQNGLIAHNQFMDKNKATYIDFTTANGGAAGDQSGAIHNNTFASDAITAGNEVKIVGTACTFAGNFTTVGVKDGSGLD